MASIVVIDDDLSMGPLIERLRYSGHDVQRMASAKCALDQLDTVVDADLVFLDIIMPWSDELTGGRGEECSTAGMEVHREIRKRHRELPVIAYTATQNGAVIDALDADSHSKFISKWGSPTLRELADVVMETLGLVEESVGPQSFIVHGHDGKAKLDLKNYLQNTLHFPEPIVLHEQPSMGRTIIEKFEAHAALASIVFVLLTSDDSAAASGHGDDQKRRARQNVIFEMGYFLGMLGRESRRVLLLHEGPLEIPSDISGLVYIDVSRGVEAAGETIRREIGHVRC